MPQTIFVSKLEYEVGSSNGEVVEILGAYAQREDAEQAVREWQTEHGCPVVGHDWEEDSWCPVCHWGADWTEVQFHA